MLINNQRLRLLKNIYWTWIWAVTTLIRRSLGCGRFIHFEVSFQRFLFSGLFSKTCDVMFNCTPICIFNKLFCLFINHFFKLVNIPVSFLFRLICYLIRTKVRAFIAKSLESGRGETIKRSISSKIVLFPSQGNVWRIMLKILFRNEIKRVWTRIKRFVIDFCELVERQLSNLFINTDSFLFF